MLHSDSDEALVPPHFFSPVYSISFVIRGASPGHFHRHSIVSQNHFCLKKGVLTFTLGTRKICRWHELSM